MVQDVETQELNENKEEIGNVLEKDKINDNNVEKDNEIVQKLQLDADHKLLNQIATTDKQFIEIKDDDASNEQLYSEISQNTQFLTCIDDSIDQMVNKKSLIQKFNEKNKK